MKLFISKLLDISHGQWLYHNFRLHSKTSGLLHLTRQEEISLEIGRLAEQYPTEIPADSHFLLDIDPSA